MAGLLALGALVLCEHGGSAEPVIADPRVTVGGQPVVALSSLYLVSGCTNAPPPLLPCVYGQFVTAAARVQVSGQPVLLDTSQAMCVPTGTGLTVTVNQVRVTAQ